VSPSILTLLAYLAGVTSRIRLGSTAVLIAFRNPIQVAEDVATIDILSKGRFDFGVAKGGPFRASKTSIFLRSGSLPRYDAGGAGAGQSATLSRPRELHRRILSGERRHDYAKAPAKADPDLFWRRRRRARSAMPRATISAVMAAPPYPLSRVLDIIETYREASGPGVDPRLTLARFFLYRPDA